MLVCIQTVQKSDLKHRAKKTQQFLTANSFLLQTVQKRFDRILGRLQKCAKRRRWCRLKSIVRWLTSLLCILFGRITSSSRERRQRELLRGTLVTNPPQQGPQSNAESVARGHECPNGCSVFRGLWTMTACAKSASSRVKSLSLSSWAGSDVVRVNGGQFLWQRATKS